MSGTFPRVKLALTLLFLLLLAGPRSQGFAQPADEQPAAAADQDTGDNEGETETEGNVEDEEQKEEADNSIQGRLNKTLGRVVSAMDSVLFYKVPLFVKKPTCAD